MKLRRKESYFRQDIEKRQYVAASARALCLTGVCSYLYYESVWSFFLLLPIGVWYFLDWEKRCIKKKEQEFQYQFKDGIQAIGAALSVGYSPENAVKEARKDLEVLYAKTSRIQQELEFMIRQLHLNVPLEQILEEWANRVEQEDVINFASIFSAAKKSGGNMIFVIRNAIRQMSGKIEVKREIETILTAKQYEFRVMSAVPFLILFYMKFSFPEFMHQLYGNLFGVGVMTVCLIIYAAAFWLGRQIIDIEV